jgi:hypothetical protein
MCVSVCRCVYLCVQERTRLQPRCSELDAHPWQLTKTAPQHIAGREARVVLGEGSPAGRSSSWRQPGAAGSDFEFRQTHR